MSGMLFLSPFLSFLRLPIPDSGGNENGHNGLPSCWHIAREGGTSPMGKSAGRFTVVKRNNERIKIPSRFESFRLQTAEPSAEPVFHQSETAEVS